MFWDRAPRNTRKSIPREYELPRYFERLPNGEPDVTKRWPGWDGWYFFVIPDDPGLAPKMIRASLMTGLYGLEGIDNYERLAFRLSTFEVAEYLSLVPTLEPAGGRKERENNLSQHYLPRVTDLRMKAGILDVSVLGAKVEADYEEQAYGRISGAWPDYEFEFLNPESGIRFSLRYRGENVVWWADFPSIFTYFAAFGRFEGEIVYEGGTPLPVSGRGSFEHGFARKAFDFDKLRRPIHLLQSILPRFKPIRYHYELLIGDQEHYGGFMKARGFGIDFRNRGGVYFPHGYVDIRKVEVEYLDEANADLVDLCVGQPFGPLATRYYRRWRVKADTSEGPLEYTAVREWPPASIGRSMIYYHFSYQGTFRGGPITGRGYGEYVHI